MSDNPQQLDRSLTLWPIVFFGLAYITPFIVLTTFGVFSEASSGTLPTAYAIAGIAMIFTALSYGKMAREFPLAGSAYTYTRKAIDSRVGFMVGWAVLLDYFFLPMVVWLIGTAYLTAEFPSVPGLGVPDRLHRPHDGPERDRHQGGDPREHRPDRVPDADPRLLPLLLAARRARRRRRWLHLRALLEHDVDARRRLRRRRTVRLQLHRLRRREHLRRRGGQPQEDDPAGDPAHRRPRRGDLRDRRLRHPARAPRRRVHRLGQRAARHRQGDRRRPVRLASSWPP